MKYHVSFDIDFKKNTSKGLYIALEGIDGSGKSKQVEELAAYFAKQKKNVLIVTEPRKDSKIFSNLVHQILLGKVSLSPIALQYLFSADRVQNQEETVIPALKAGKIVISHRSLWSIVPYAVSDLNPKLYKDTAQFLLVANSVLSMYHQFILPDYTFYLEVTVDEAMRRLEKRKNKEKEFYETKEKLKKHVIGYQWEINTFPKEFTIIEGKQNPEKVTEEIIKRIKIRKR
jgi:dTMP kinase